MPLSAINGVGFAFKDGDQALGAMDGALGALVRADIAKRGLMAFAPHLRQRLPPGHHQRAAP